MARQWVLGLVAVLVFAACALAQTPAAHSAQAAAAPPQAASSYLIPYGAPITLEDARKAATAALAETRKNGWLMAVAVVDPDGELVYYEKMDNVQNGSARAAIGKARSAALYKRPTKAFETAVSGGGAGMRVLGLEGVVPLEGGLPLMVEGKIIGAIGASGDVSENDGKCAKAGADALAKK